MKFSTDDIREAMALHTAGAPKASIMLAGRIRNADATVSASTLAAARAALVETPPPEAESSTVPTSADLNNAAAILASVGMTFADIEALASKPAAAVAAVVPAPAPAIAARSEAVLAARAFNASRKR